jgi:ribosomal protein S18 acetylase RimI-like enzyme
MTIPSCRTKNIAASPPFTFCLAKPIKSSSGHSITLGPAVPEDENFLRLVYAGTRQEELALLDCDDTMKAAFINMQFSAQRSHYQSVYPEADYLIILEDEVPAGRLYINRSDNNIHIIDIALVPGCRGRGTGTELLQYILDEGERQGRTVSIYVEKFNRALQLYLRFGFVETEDQGVYLFMKWSPGKR